MKSVFRIFGSMMFCNSTMSKKLPKDTYEKLKSTIKTGADLDSSIANVVANAMKDWAIEKGATHFAHWFHPMNDLTAQKHDSFIFPTSSGGVIMEFSGKELIKGEPDASSFPSGGLRTTFEARGYTAWDPTSYAFIKGHTLYIPTVFYSYGGEALDKKTPLLRSVKAINDQTLRILKLFGNTSAKNVRVTVGPEQEYFLIDKEIYKKRKDLVLCGRTLFGADSPKGQELEEHYFGAIRPRVMEFMNKLNKELWKLGVFAKTEHNEVAPAQHEIAVTFTSVNIATDHNQLVMETMKYIAEKMDLVCLLHEKPFKGINGSGKHNNWSISTDSGVNLLDPGLNPYENDQFLLILCGIIKGVDEYQDLLRLSVASAGNDHRLGANEAPPAIISIFLGRELTEILEAIENKENYSSLKVNDIELGVNVLPHTSKDATDRNRTSPFAFTGNKFELRMLGSKESIADVNTILNTIVAEELCFFADELEKSKNLKEDLNNLIAKTLKQHKRIIFNGNNYSKEWKEEAKNRGLLNLKTTADALPYLIKEKNVKLFLKHGVYTKSELYSRYDVRIKNYCRIIDVEARTLIDLVKKQIIPAVINYQKDLLKVASMKKFINKNIDSYLEDEICIDIARLSRELFEKLKNLEEVIDKLEFKNKEKTLAYHETSILQSMSNLRSVVDELEKNVSKEFWPFPTYSELLFSV
ncbi:MAG: glutamine synthetase III [Oscillospiraceae bacterium]|nr:glutamine synthetase III [Oscillospiraceae bacterium]